MMYKTREDLVKAVLGDDKHLRGAQLRFKRKIERLFSDYKTRVELMLRRPKKFGITDRIGIQATGNVIEQMTGILAEAGMDDLVADYLDEFPDLTKRALKHFTGLEGGTNLAGVDVDRLDAYISFSEQRLRAVVDKRLVAPMQEAVFSATFGTKPVEDIIADVMTKAEWLSPAQAETTVWDSLIQYERAVTVEKAASLKMDIFIYEGPSDEITSPQCQALLDEDRHGLPGALYRDEISADLHEDLRDNPLIAGGHPNCRHKYMPVTEDYAVSLGFEPRGGSDG